MKRNLSFTSLASVMAFGFGLAHAGNIPTFVPTMPNFNATLQQNMHSLQNSMISLRQTGLQIQNNWHWNQEQLQRTIDNARSVPSQPYYYPVPTAAYPPYSTPTQDIVGPIPFMAPALPLGTTPPDPPASMLPGPYNLIDGHWVIAGPPACRTQTLTYCRHIVAGGGRILACLRQNSNYLPDPCWTVLTQLSQRHK